MFATSRWGLASAFVLAAVSVFSLGAFAAPAWGSSAPQSSGSLELPGQDKKSAVIPGHYIVVLKDSVAHPGAVATAQTQQRDGDVGLVYRHALKGYSATLPKEEVAALERDPRVASVTPDHKVEVASQTIPTGIERAFAPTNPSLDIDETDDVRVDVDVAIIDTGIAAYHPDLNVFKRAYCVESSEEEECLLDLGLDGVGHGTHVAGTVAALDNGEGVVGVAPGARLWAVQVYSPKGDGGSEATIIAGVDWVTAHASEIEVANMSLECWGFLCGPLDEAIEASAEAGVVYVAAAGNSSAYVSHTPASNPDVITVSALADYDGEPGGEGTEVSCEGHGNDDTLADFSNFGEDVEVAAPGVCIYSTWPYGGGYEYATGTSMAAPHVTGAAAILASKLNPENLEDVEEIREMIEAEGRAAEETGLSSWTDTSGDGVKEPLLYVGEEFGTGAAPATFAFAFASLGTEPGHLLHPTDVATDSSGNVWVADTENNRVQKFDGEGKYLSQFGTEGSGNGQLYGPTGIAIDSSGNVWVADTQNDRIQKFNSSGTYVSKFGTPGSGNGQLSAPTALAIDSSGNVWVADTGNNRIQKFNSKGEYLSQFGSSGSGNGQLSGPTALAIGPESHIWVADTGNNRIQKFNSSGTYVSKFGSSGSGEGQFAAPSGLAIDSSGSVWVADTENNRIQKFSSEGKYLNQVGEEGLGDGEFDGPMGIEIDAEGSFWIADSENNRVQEWFPRMAPLATTQAASGLKTNEATLQASIHPKGLKTHYRFEYGTTTSYGTSVPVLAKDIGSGIKASGVSEKISGLSAGTTYHYRVVATNVIGTTKGKDATFTTLSPPVVSTTGASPVKTTEATLNGTVNPKGVATTYQFEYGTTTSYGTSIPVSPKSAGSGAEAINVNEKISSLKGNTTYHFRLSATSEAGTTNGSDKTFTTPPIAFAFAFGTEGSGNGQLNGPRGIATDASGNVWVADTENNRIQKFNSKGEYLSKFGSSGSGNGQLGEPADLAIDSSGNVWVADTGNNRIQKFNSSGTYVSKFGSSGSGNGQFAGPSGIAIGPESHIWVADTGNARIQEFDSSGKYLRQFDQTGKESSLTEPRGITFDAEGNLWVADGSAGQLVQFTRDGLFLTQVSSSELPFSDVAIDPRRELWVAQEGISRLMEFHPEGTSAGEFGEPGSGEGQLSEPGGIATDSSGNVWIADTANNRIQKWEQAPSTSVGTEAASKVKWSEATLNGSINPEGVETSYRFEYGLTTSYGTNIPVSPKSIGSGTKAMAVSQTITGLEPEATYHYRVVAIREGKSIYGADRSFTYHLPWAPTSAPKAGALWHAEGGKTFEEAGVSEQKAQARGYLSMELPELEVTITCRQSANVTLLTKGKVEEQISLSGCKVPAEEDCEVASVTMATLVGVPAELKLKSGSQLMELKISGESCWFAGNYPTSQPTAGFQLAFGPQGEVSQLLSDVSAKGLLGGYYEVLYSGTSIWALESGKRFGIW